jgi:hypothetical protein
MSSESHQPNAPTCLDASAQTTALDSIEIDVAQLKQLLSQEPSAESETEIAELLQRLESVDGMARGVESRLDDVLGNLNDLLASLETSNVVAGSDGDHPDGEVPPKEGTEG